MVLMEFLVADADFYECITVLSVMPYENKPMCLKVAFRITFFYGIPLGLAEEGYLHSSNSKRVGLILPRISKLSKLFIHDPWLLSLQCCRNLYPNHQE